MHRTPIQIQKVTGLAQTAAGLQHFDGQALKKHRPLTMFVGPRNLDKFGMSIRILQPRDMRHNDGLKLHGR